MSRVTNCLGLFVVLLPAAVQAEPPYGDVSADMFDITYRVLDADGTPVRDMDGEDRAHFVNRARCECGQAIQVEVKLEPAEDLNPARVVQSFLGLMCATAEVNPIGDYKKCVQLLSAPVPTYFRDDIAADVHPAWLTGGVDPTSKSRAPDEGITVGSCAGGTGTSGAWLCAQTNTMSGCQVDEFIVTAEQTPLVYDFDPPTVAPTAISVEPYSRSALVEWDIEQPGDIFGYRVLCAEAGTGAPPVHAMARPDITAAPRGHYFTADNLCGGEPFTAIKFAERPAGPAVCGDGVVQAGEACDDGADNRDDGLCSSECELLVSAGLHALDWGHVCSQHVAFHDTTAIAQGLEDGKTYDVVLATYDSAGNPRAYPRVLQVTPDASLPSLVAQEEGCGCTAATGPGGLLLVFGGLLVRRRRVRDIV